MYEHFPRHIDANSSGETIRIITATFDPCTMRERCLEHGLATGPDGACVLCRSRKRPTRAPQLALMIVVLGAIAVGLVFWRLARTAVDRAPLRLEPANAASGPATFTAATPATRSTEAARSEVTTDRIEQPVFSERDPRGLPSELRARGETDVVGEYLAGKESYELFLPAACLAGEPHGILVWIGSGPSGALPSSEWRRVLAAHRLIWAGPNHVGNEREIALRIGLALDSVLAVSRRFTLDRGRVYVGGLSGGAKSAFRALTWLDSPR